MSRIVNRRTVLAAIVLIAAAIFLPPFVNISRFKPRIAGALSRSLGRQVSIGHVELRVFPAPGLKMANVVVEDDPSYSEEPFLRADEVNASFRLTSLWRGRLEIARLSFLYPSVNVVRRADGHWNLESLFERARQVPVAPTTRKTAGQRPRFPYIESDTGRVNLKIGREKTVWALTDADFAVWLEHEDQWNLRIAARAIRTDANLSDTGTLKLSGTVRRARSLNEMPLDLHFTLDGAQLGQLTTLIYGRDRGWRGTVNVSGTLNGTPAALKVATEASVGDFRRYDIATAGNLRLASNCTAMFSSNSQQISDIDCQSPVGNGYVETRGTVTGLSSDAAYELSVAARELPASSLAALVHRMKKDLPEDVSADGVVNARFTVRRPAAGEPVWEGNGLASKFVLRSSRMEEPLTVGEVRFGLPNAPVAAPVRGKRNTTPAPTPPDTLVVEPFAVDLGGTAPANAKALFSHDGYRIDLSGATGLHRLLQVSEALGVAAPRFAPEGSAVLAVSVTGQWAGFAQPLVLGSANVKATATLAGIAAPVEVTSATVRLTPDAVNVQDLSFGWSKAAISATGTMQLPRHCTTIETCPVKFQLRSDSLSVEDVNALVNPKAEKRPWYAAIVGGDSKPPLLGRVTASGTLTVSTLKAGVTTAKAVTAQVSLNHGVFAAQNVVANALGGKITGDLRADFDAAPPKFSATGKIDGGSVAALAGPLRQSWGTGKLDANFKIDAAGSDFASVTKAATGEFHYVWRDGTVAFGLDGGAGPLRIHDLRGVATLRDGSLSFAPSRMQTGSGIYTLSGTASLDRQLGLTLARGNTPAYQITGTLDKPKVTPSTNVPQTQARLQP